MTSFETSQGFVNVEKYRLNVTARLDTANREHMKDLIEKTVRVWLYVAKNIEAGMRVLSLNTTPEDMIKANHFAPIAEPRVTVWADLPGSGAGFTVHSHSHAQDAIDVYFARQDALALFAPTTPPQSNSTPTEAQNAAFANLGSQTGNSAPAPKVVDGIISATRAPNPKEVLYADGQMVSFVVNKIVMGTNNGSVTYALWGPLGARFPLKTIYKTKAGSDANSSDYIAMKDLIVGLGLSVDAGKIEAAGNWALVCKAAHVAQPDGSTKEYLNIQSATVIQQGIAA